MACGQQQRHRQSWGSARAWGPGQAALGGRAGAGEETSQMKWTFEIPRRREQ